MAVPILRMAVPSPLHRLFDYLPPAGCDPRNLRPGMRLRLPFGRGRVVGVLMALAPESELPREKLKRAEALLDEVPLFDAPLLELLRWCTDYYHHPIGEVVATALPRLLRQGEAPRPRPRRFYRLTGAGREQDLQALGRRARRQALLMARLKAAAAPLEAATLGEGVAQWRQVVEALERHGWIERCEPAPPATTAPPGLNDDQRRAVEAIIGADGFSAFLLDGVTGSGKTEVYLRAAKRVGAAGRQVLIVVPEITLTPQLVARFEGRLGTSAAVLHSAMGDTERLEAWRRARSGEAAVVVGTRSAIFTPLPRPGLIVVDEEHDPSLKQQSGLRYSARDLALVRGRIEQVPVVLGSATPSLETLHNAAQRRYTHLRLPQRAGGAALPPLKLLDVRGRPMEEQLSEPLLERIGHHLGEGGQVVLFLNRRGYAPALICHECGWVAHCRRCDVPLTFHRASRSLRCHHCAGQRPVARQCPECGSVDLRPLGAGTERIDEALRHHFPDAGVARLDRDTTRRKGSVESILEQVREGRARILVGTQMLAKGHDFPAVTLVGIVDGDQGLFGIDFRAAERMAQLITQVAGRAGRGERAGEVVIQTRHPDHPMLQRLCREGYHAFAAEALAERRTTALPPFSHLALLRAEAARPELPEAFLERAAEAARELNVVGVECSGPLPSPMERRAGKFRAQLLLQSASRAALHTLLGRWVEGLGKLEGVRRVRWSLDVDPVDLM